MNTASRWLLVLGLFTMTATVTGPLASRTRLMTPGTIERMVDGPEPSAAMIWRSRSRRWSMKLWT